MSLTAKFIIFQAMIIVPFILGSLTKERFSNQTGFTKKLIRINLICIEPLIVLWSIWGISLKSNLVFLPVFGLAFVLTGMAIGKIFIPVLGISDKKKATFLISSSLSNHGFTMGGFLCYLLMGEKGLGLSFIFISYFMPYIFLVIFPYASLVSTHARYDMRFVRDFFFNIQNMPLYAFFFALALQGCGFKRPEIFFPIDILLMIAIALYHFSLGINFEFKEVLSSRKENMALGMIKFFIIPMITFLVLRWVALDPQIEVVIMLQSFMPTAVYSVMVPVLYDLDAKLASSLFVVNTLIFLIIVLPIVFMLKTSLLGI
jgi:Predicted permeases